MWTLIQMRLKFLISCVLFCITIQTVSVTAESIPRLILIGDSTVKCGSGQGGGGLWGWGSFLDEHFDAEKIQIENHARGGRSSRTYLTEGLWEKALARLRPGDYVLMQFGHNDGGEMFEGDRPRASIKGNGNESQDGVVELNGKKETVHSYGWYLRKYISDAKAKGATPIVLSLIPRDRWEGEPAARRVIRSNRDYGLWAKEAAGEGKAHFIDLNEIVSLRYEELGEEKVGRDFFTEDDWTHTVKEGAKVNAACVAEGIRNLCDCNLKDFLLKDEGKSNEHQSIWRFDFGNGPVAKSSQQVQSSTVYSEKLGYGLHEGTQVESVTLISSHPYTQDALQSNSPFFFSVDLPEGNYRVKVTGGRHPLTVKAELRRLMFQLDELQASAPLQREFTVNLRTPKIEGDQKVRLKPREKKEEAWAWDNRLTLEFNGSQPCVSSLVIESEPEAITVFLAGDSTVTDQPYAPWNSWGQMLPQFFSPGIAIANHAESGESIRSSLGAGRFNKIFSLMIPGDYLFIQFGHNDMKDKSPDALEKYREHLIKIIGKTQEIGGLPVLVTSMERKSGISRPTLESYPNTVRDVASEMNIPLIDLHKMSRTLYRALGEDLNHAFQDGTHHNNYGSYLLAKCVVQGILENKLLLADYIVAEFTSFDPNKPDRYENFHIPISPVNSLDAPDGS